MCIEAHHVACHRRIFVDAAKPFSRSLFSVPVGSLLLHIGKGSNAIEVSHVLALVVHVFGHDPLVSEDNRTRRMRGIFFYCAIVFQVNKNHQ